MENLFITRITVDVLSQKPIKAADFQASFHDPDLEHNVSVRTVCGKSLRLKEDEVGTQLNRHGITRNYFLNVFPPKCVDVAPCGAD